MYKLQLREEAIVDLPELFKYNDIADVTELHGIGSRDVQISRNLTDKTSVYYLSVFTCWLDTTSSFFINQLLLCRNWYKYYAG